MSLILYLISALGDALKLPCHDSTVHCSNSLIPQLCLTSNIPTRNLLEQSSRVQVQGRDPNQCEASSEVSILAKCTKTCVEFHPELLPYTDCAASGSTKYRRFQKRGSNPHKLALGMGDSIPFNVSVPSGEIPTSALFSASTPSPKDLKDHHESHKRFALDGRRRLNPAVSPRGVGWTPLKHFGDVGWHKDSMPKWRSQKITIEPESGTTMLTNLPADILDGLGDRCCGEPCVHDWDCKQKMPSGNGLYCDMTTYVCSANETTSYHPTSPSCVECVAGWRPAPAQRRSHVALRPSSPAEEGFCLPDKFSIMGDRIRKQRHQKGIPPTVGEFYCESLTKDECLANEYGHTSFCKWFGAHEHQANWRLPSPGTGGDKRRGQNNWKYRLPNSNKGWKYHQPFGWASNMIMFSDKFKADTRGMKDYLFSTSDWSKGSSMYQSVAAARTPLKFRREDEWLGEWGENSSVLEGSMVLNKKKFITPYESDEERLRKREQGNVSISSNELEVPGADKYHVNWLENKKLKYAAFDDFGFGDMQFPNMPQTGPLSPWKHVDNMQWAQSETSIQSNDHPGISKYQNHLVQYGHFHDEMAGRKDQYGDLWLFERDVRANPLNHDAPIPYTFVNHDLGDNPLAIRPWGLAFPNIPGAPWPSKYPEPEPPADA